MTSGKTIARGVAAAALALLMAGMPLVAQITTGTIAGSVKDEQGAAVPGATVTLIIETRATRADPTVSNAVGDFVASTASRPPTR